jgi:hypothetical protein
MRLLDTTTYILSEFQGDIPAYAILSHVWQREEVTFSDIATLNKAAKLKGFTKIVGACKTALKEGLKYIWIDTCCINKESSAELSEAINSMFIWYKNARVCYAYLSDVPGDEDPSELNSSFVISRWFTRGWTLQELLAPLRVIFYGTNWVNIGDKGTLRETISIAIGIDTKQLVGIDEDGEPLKLEDVPVGVRMSWAAHRLTTREEDTAYSLLGLFGVNMPLLYGEGSKAFIRLQHEIIKAYDDHSIFAFKGEGMLARSPSQFRESGEVGLLGDIGELQAPYAITNKGLYIQLPLCDIMDEESRKKKTVALFNCCRVGKSERLAVTLTTCNSKGLYKREYNGLMFGLPSWWIPDRPLPAWQLHSIYIEDHGGWKPRSGDEWMDSSAHGLLLTATVPVEYGKLKLSKRFRQEEPIEELAENEWRLILRPVVDDLSLTFKNGNKDDKFSMTLGLTDNLIMWCALETFWKDSGPKYFSDSFSGILNDEWAVTLTYRPGGTSSSGTDFAHHAAIEIKRAAVPTTRRPVAIPERPIDTFLTWLVTPPAPDHGYTLAENDISPPSDPSIFIKCIPHHGSFIVYTGVNILGGTIVVPFKSSGSGRPFYLLLGQDNYVSSTGGATWATAISQSESDASFDFNTTKVIGATYSRTLDRVKTVYVASWRSRDTSLADHIIELSM